MIFRFAAEEETADVHGDPRDRIDKRHGKCRRPQAAAIIGEIGPRQRLNVHAHAGQATDKVFDDGEVAQLEEFRIVFDLRAKRRQKMRTHERDIIPILIVFSRELFELTNERVERRAIPGKEYERISLV